MEPLLAYYQLLLFRNLFQMFAVAASGQVAHAGTAASFAASAEAVACAAFAA